MIYEALKASNAVTSITDERISQSVLPEGWTRPYVIWTIVAGVPLNTLSENPTRDDQRIQVDCYAMDQKICGQLRDAVRDAVETQGHVVFGPWAEYEQDTRLFRWSMDVEIFKPR